MPKRLFLGILVVILALLPVEIATRTGWLNQAEDFYYDLWHQLAGRRYEPRQVVIAAIDDQTRLEHQDEPLVFWSPHFSKAIGVLRQVGARVIGLDYLFSLSAEAWLKRLKLPESDLSRTYDLPFREQLASGQIVLAGSLIVDAQGKGRVLLPIADYWGALPGKLDDVGLVNLYNDSDGVIRRFVSAIPDDEGDLWMTFGELLADRAVSREAGASGSLRHISFAGPPGTIPRLSFRRLLNPDAETNPEVRGLRDKVVIIGSELSGFQDIHMTPYAMGLLGFKAGMMSGAEIHANIVETLLRGKFPRPVPPWGRLVYLLAVLIAGAVLFFRWSPLPGIAVAALLSLVVAILGFLLFQGDWILPVAASQLGLSLAYLGTLGIRLTGEERERIRLRQIFGRYVSDEVVEKILLSGKQPDLGGQACQVTILFADIRDFTTMAESLNPSEVVEMLNSYFSRVCEPILEQGGSVDKFIGDAVMAVFGSPAPHPDHARRAIGAALAMADLAQEFRVWMAQRFQGRNLPPFSIGIGLHTGEAVVGNIGSPKRLEFTSVGDTVNTASRLEGLTKELGWLIIASRETVEAAGPGVLTGGRENLCVKGRQEPVEVLQVLGLEPEGAKNLGD